MKRYIRNYYSILALAAVLCVAGCEEDEEPVVVSRDVAPVTQALIDNSELVSTVFWDTTFVVAPGVEETDIHYLSMKGLPMHMFILKVDLKQEGVELSPMTPYAATSFGMQSVPEMMGWVDEPGKKVVAGFNADFFDMTSGVPRGVVHLDGEIIKDIPMVGRSVVGIDNSGQPVIVHSDDYPAVKDGLVDALGASNILLKDYVKTPIPASASLTEPEPRTAIGFTENDEVYFVVVDGREFQYSNGMSLDEVAEVFMALGVKDATNLDGGGSSTFVTLHSVADVWHVRNRPSDGSPRPVGNGWAILVNQN
ncbi:MAG TPA: phosphodiester glycosidase family protein [Chryseosolibacter sp.]|nr:phosphodiester glycosidase family protein [Chryseosolibacter sp.]